MWTESGPWMLGSTSPDPGKQQSFCLHPDFLRVTAHNSEIGISKHPSIFMPQFGKLHNYLKSPGVLRIKDKGSSTCRTAWSAGVRKALQLFWGLDWEGTHFGLGTRQCLVLPEVSVPREGHPSYDLLRTAGWGCFSCCLAHPMLRLKIFR